MSDDNQTTTADESVESPAEAVADVSVDLSADDPPEASEPDTQSVEADLIHDDQDQAPPTPDPEAADRENDDFEEEYGIAEDELRQQSRQEAKRILNSIDSDDPTEMIEEADGQFREKHSSILQQFRQTQSQAEKLRKQRERLLETVERLREIADDEDKLVIKTMAGGIAESLSPEEREDIASEYEQRCGEFEAQADQLEDRADALKRDLKKIEYACQELRNPQGILSEVVAGSIADL